MPKIIDLTGQRFNKLTVLYRDTKTKSRNIRWICKCDCGTIKSIQGTNLKNGLTQSCGCLHKSKISSNLIGQKFGKLTILKDSGKRTSNRGIIWECLCDCGNITKVSTNNLKQSITFSCGCLKQSHGEYLIEQLLIKNEVQYKKEYTFSDLISPQGGKLRFDFAIFNQNELQYLIEYDGETHSLDYIQGWNTKEKIEYQILCDKLKNDYCKEKNIPLKRISYLQKNNITYEDLRFD